MKTSNIFQNKSFYLIALILFAIALRVPLLNIDLYGDEIQNFTWYKFLPLKELLLGYTDPNQHTFFILLSIFSMKVFGEQEWVFRLPVLLAGILSIPMIYKVSYSIFKSSHVSILTSFLLTVSYYPVHYSQNGRGYSLTLFLSLSLIYAAIKLAESETQTLWKLVLPVSGFCMILDLPTNFFFLIAAVLFYLIIQFDEHNFKKTFFYPCFNKNFMPFWILFGSVALYWYLILPDLVRAVQLSKQYPYQNNLPAIAKFLVEPWGFWIYLCFLFGLYEAHVKEKLFPILAIIFVPILLNLISGTTGPPRTYIYWIPFVLTISSLGIWNIISRAQEKFQLKNPATFYIGIMTLLIIQPFFKLSYYYRVQQEVIGTSLTDGRKAFTYIEEDKYPNSLIVIKDSILQSFIGQETIKRNYSVVKNETLKNIIFIGKRDMTFNDFMIEGNLISKQKKFPNKLLKVIDKIGKLIVYQFNGEISKVRPSDHSLDSESKFNFKQHSKFSQKVEASSEMFGENILKFTKNTDENIFIISPDQVAIEAEGTNEFLLVVSGKKYNQESKQFIAEKLESNLAKHSIKKILRPEISFGNDGGSFGFLPYYYYINFIGHVFYFKDGAIIPVREFPLELLHRRWELGFGRPDHLWEMRYILYPLEQRKHAISKAFYLADRGSAFDEFLIYSLRGAEN